MSKDQLQQTLSELETIFAEQVEQGTRGEIIRSLWTEILVCRSILAELRTLNSSQRANAEFLPC